MSADKLAGEGIALAHSRCMVLKRKKKKRMGVIHVDRTSEGPEPVCEVILEETPIPSTSI